MRVVRGRAASRFAGAEHEIDAAREAGGVGGPGGGEAGRQPVHPQPVRSLDARAGQAPAAALLPAPRPGGSAWRSGAVPPPSRPPGRRAAAARRSPAGRRRRRARRPAGSRQWKRSHWPGGRRRHRVQTGVSASARVSSTAAAAGASGAGASGSASRRCTRPGRAMASSRARKQAWAASTGSAKPGVRRHRMRRHGEELHPGRRRPRRILRRARRLGRGQGLDHRRQQRRAPVRVLHRRHPAPPPARPAAHRGRRHRHGRCAPSGSRTLQRVTVISPRLKGAPSPPCRPRAMTSPLSGPRSRVCGGQGRGIAPAAPRSRPRWRGPGCAIQRRRRVRAVGARGGVGDQRRGGASRKPCRRYKV